MAEKELRFKLDDQTQKDMEFLLRDSMAANRHEMLRWLVQTEARRLEKEIHAHAHGIKTQVHFDAGLPSWDGAVKTYSLDFLAWFRLCAFYPQNAYEDLRSQGASPFVANTIVSSSAFRHCDLIQLYADWGQAGEKDECFESCAEAIQKYIDHYHVEWEALQRCKA